MRYLLIATVAVLAGCSVLAPAYDRCDKPAAYADAAEVPPLAIPEGVDAPDRRNALRIPEVVAPRKPPDGRCVDAPPDYFPNRTPGQG